MSELALKCRCEVGLFKGSVIMAPNLDVMITHVYECMGCGERIFRNYERGNHTWQVALEDVKAQLKSREVTSA